MTEPLPADPLLMPFAERAYWLEANLGGPVIRHQLKDSLIADYERLLAEREECRQNHRHRNEIERLGTKTRG